jgi:hypothetical protein
LVRIDHTFLIRSGGFEPIIFPLFQGTFVAAAEARMTSDCMLDLLC